jgi:hypothetical protein
MTSWSTSGQYSPVFESENEMTEEYAIRHVYPLSGFNMLIAAFAESIKSAKPLDIDSFIAKYCSGQYGFDARQAARFWKALKTAPYEIAHGRVESPVPLTVKQLLDSTQKAAETLYDLHPKNNKEEFEHYKLMAGIRLHYIQFHDILQRVNSSAFTNTQVPGILQELKNLMINQEILNLHFIELNKNFLDANELKEENDLRNIRVRLLYDRLSRNK